MLLPVSLGVSRHIQLMKGVAVNVIALIIVFAAVAVILTQTMADVLVHVLIRVMVGMISYFNS